MINARTMSRSATCSNAIVRPFYKHSFRGRILFTRKWTYSSEHESLTNSISNNETNALVFVQDLGLFKNQISHRIPSALWSVEFSVDGKYLAAAGKSTIIYVWKLKEIIEDPFLVFTSDPISELQGHKSDILGISWSNTGDILSCSLDGTTRLWDPNRGECIYLFNHNDGVTSIAFHPLNDSMFVSGTVHGQLCLWNSKNPECVETQYIPNTLITSVAFDNDGRTVMVGSYRGKCLFFDSLALKYQTQLQIKMKSKLKKITGIEIIPPDDRILISSNDSRIRILSRRDKTQIAVLGGHSNYSSLIKPRCSEDGKYLISGSEDHKVYVWKNIGRSNDVSGQTIFGRFLRRFNGTRFNQPIKSFTGHNFKVTAAMFAPLSVTNHIRRLMNGFNESNVIVMVSADTGGHLKIWRINSIN
jgi:WD40 repeat protein